MPIAFPLSVCFAIGAYCGVTDVNPSFDLSLASGQGCSLI
jgi:hypothetical protein